MLWKIWKEVIIIDSKFTTNYYKVLEIFYDNQVEILGEKCCPISQEDIAKQINCNRMTVCSIIKELVDDGYVLQNEKQRKKYYLSDKAQDLIKKIKKIK